MSNTVKSKIKKNTVLVIDDDEDLLKLIVSSFKRKGFEVLSFENGSKALSYISKKENLEPVCLILLDRILPDMDGLTILGKLDNQAQIPVLVLSMLSTEKDMLEGLQKGAVDYMTKPFSIPILMEKAQRLILNEQTF
jgi:DNA-binding response OmpR family regulator